MTRYGILTLIAAAVLTLTVEPKAAVAQQNQKVSFKSVSENSKFMQQLNVDVGDSPGHIVRIFDVHRTYPTNAPVINGLKLAEESDRGIADLTSGNGSGTFYAVYVMEDGDKFFVRAATLIQSGSGGLTATNVGLITGGTGKLAGMQGSLQQTVTFNPKTGFNESQTNIEYSVGK